MESTQSKYKRFKLKVLFVIQVISHANLQICNSEQQIPIPHKLRFFQNPKQFLTTKYLKFLLQFLAFLHLSLGNLEKAQHSLLIFIDLVDNYFSVRNWKCELWCNLLLKQFTKEY